MTVSDAPPGAAAASADGSVRTSTPAPQRVVALDGLRGWAALSVVFFHLTWETFGAAFPVFRTPPFALLGNGPYAVALFLMVSGYVLTIGGWRNADKRPMVRSIAKRYPRLTIPILASVLLFWALISLGLTASPVAGRIVNRPDWLAQFADLRPNLVDALWFGLVQVYITTGQHSYGPFLWTMTVELWGSFIVLLACLLELPGVRGYLLLLAVCGASFYTKLDPYFPVAACYPAGAIVALLVRDGIIRSSVPGRLESTVATAGVVVGLVTSAAEKQFNLGLQLTTVAAILTFVGVIRSRPALAFLRLRVSLWLGAISFPLYLVQILILTTVTSDLIVAARGAGLLNPWTAAAVAGVSLPLCLVAAQLFLSVERGGLKVARWLGERIVPLR